jgi:IS1 family transposase
VVSSQKAVSFLTTDHWPLSTVFLRHSKVSVKYHGFRSHQWNSYSLKHLFLRAISSQRSNRSIFYLNLPEERAFGVGFAIQ